MKKKLFVLMIFLMILIYGCSNKNSIEIDNAINEVKIVGETSGNIVLPKNTSNNVSIEWSSSNEQYLTKEGVVNQPSYLDGDQTITLTAKFVFGSDEKIKQYTIKILAEEEQDKSIIKNSLYYKDYYQYKYEGEEIPFMKNWKIAGLYNKDGSLHILPVVKERTNKINVIYYGAKSGDPSYDNTSSFKAAIDNSKEDDVIYVPNGEYYFKSHMCSAPYYAHILLKSNISLIGESKDGVKFISSFTEKECLNTANTATIAALNCNNVKIENITCSAIVDDRNLPNPLDLVNNNPNGNKTAPQFGIVIHGNSEKTYNVTVENCKVEYFQYSGIRLHCVSDCKIINCNIEKATDIGGGGAGYGIEIRGFGHEKYEYIDTIYDSCFNIISGCTVTGPYIRHGIILSYMTHNNLFDHNNVIQSQDDSFDVHGQDEFLNVFAYNIACNDRAAAGFALGNTGSTHDKSGVGNVFWKNISESNPRGFTVCRGTKYTIIVENTIKSCGVSLNTDHTDESTTIWKDNN